MPSRFDGEWLRSNVPGIAQTMDRFIDQIKEETHGEILGDLEIVRIPLDLYRARTLIFAGGLAAARARTRRCLSGGSGHRPRCAQRDARDLDALPRPRVRAAGRLSAVPRPSGIPRPCGTGLSTLSRRFPPASLLTRPGAILRRRPPSTSGLGHGPFKAVARVRIPSGALANGRRAGWLRRSVAPLSKRAVSSVGRAPGLHPGGRWFEPGTAHHGWQAHSDRGGLARLSRGAR
jgi:hypothetical protein